MLAVLKREGEGKEVAEGRREGAGGEVVARSADAAQGGGGEFVRGFIVAFFLDINF